MKLACKVSFILSFLFALEIKKNTKMFQGSYPQPPPGLFHRPERNDK